MKRQQTSNHQMGFGPIVFLLALVIVGLVVAAGVLVMHSRSDKFKPVSTVSSSAKAKSTTPSTPLTNYANANFSLKYPSDWTMRSSTLNISNFICLESPDAVEAPHAYEIGACHVVTTGAWVSVIVAQNTAKGQNIVTAPACSGGDVQQESHSTINDKTVSIFDCTNATPTIAALPDYHVVTTRIPYSDTAWLDVEYWQALVGDKTYTATNQQILNSIKLLSPTIPAHSGG